ncbi:hypothetical protein F5X96DRAFT_130531 [Biscogniauxia mediterranea]|nr:hypothetical protein F5X96DRAFT_130531 [Biscogniauxia mediterranea]
MVRVDLHMSFYFYSRRPSPPRHTHPPFAFTPGSVAVVWSKSTTGVGLFHCLGFIVFLARTPDDKMLCHGATPVYTTYISRRPAGQACISTALPISWDALYWGRWLVGEAGTDYPNIIPCGSSAHLPAVVYDVCSCIVLMISSVLPYSLSELVV